jgi:hypothetical protein
MNKTLGLKIGSRAGFIISSIFTIMLMTSGSVGIVSWILMAIMAIIFEIAKFSSFYFAITEKRFAGYIRFTLGLTGCVLVAISIMASSAYIQNEANKTKNIQVEKSTEYKSITDSKALQQKEYDRITKELADLESFKVKQDIDGKNAINALPSNYTTKRMEMNKTLSANLSATQESINKKSAELTSVASGLKVPVNVSGIKVNADSGYTAMFTVLADFYNANTEGGKESPISPEEFEMMFFLFLGALLEIVSVLLMYVSDFYEQFGFVGKEIIKNEDVNIKEPTKEIQSEKVEVSKSDNIIPIKKEVVNTPIKTIKKASANIDKKIGYNYSNLIQPTNTNTDSVAPKVETKTIIIKEAGEKNEIGSIFTQEQLDAYKESMYKTAVDNQSKGFKVIAKDADLTQKVASNIRDYLLAKGELSCEGNGNPTYIVDKD